MTRKSLLILVLTTFVISGCTSLQQNRNACIAAGAVAGALAGGLAQDDNEAETALGGAILGGVAAWVICRTDTDGDGVLDENDSCPGTPKSATVDPRGCALDTDKDGIADYMDACPNSDPGAAVDSKGCDKDSDGDGVRDDLDRCPNTPRGESVDAKGCSLDSDKDGVTDSADACPNTAAGKMVDARGCHTVFTLSGVNFDYDSADLTSAADKELGKAIKLLRQQPGLKVSIVGYTDSRGSDKYNLKLSDRRAKSVLDFLVQGGISSDRLNAMGKGESNPVASNDTDDGRAMNRRVEFIVTDN